MAEAPFQDPAYLRGIQYKDATNLNARLALHRGFSTNPYGWASWLFDRVLESLGSGPRRVLEVGCGAGTMWSENRERIPRDWSLTLSDASAGMAAQARQALGARAACLVCDANALPFRAGGFGSVIANHMLYHVGDRRHALAELRRTLAPDGILIASTVGDDHMFELDQYLTKLGVPAELLGRQVSAPFTLENGAAQLREHFGAIEVHRYDDNLEVTEVEPLIGYIKSMTAGTQLPSGPIDDLRAELGTAIADRGFVWITKSSGVFIARSSPVTATAPHRP